MTQHGTFKTNCLSFSASTLESEPEYAKWCNREIEREVLTIQNMTEIMLFTHNLPQSHGGKFQGDEKDIIYPYFFKILP